jgi:hypothetical protein
VGARGAGRPRVPLGYRRGFASSPWAAHQAR